MLDYLRQHVRLLGQQFSEPEAWQLFRLAAFAEAVGWTLLITGIIIATYVTPGNRDAVVIAGQIHGMIFFAYVIAAALFAPSLEWSPLKTVLALGASVPPYGSLVFEWFANRSRNQNLARDYLLIQAYKLLQAAG